MTATFVAARLIRPAKSPAELLSDAAIDLAAGRSVDIPAAAAALIEQSDHERGLIETAHTFHNRRMAQRPSDDFKYSRALRIIETAIRRLPRVKPPLYDIASPRPGILGRLRARRTQLQTP